MFDPSPWVARRGSTRQSFEATFCAMVIMITKDIGWTWKYAVAVIVLGPIGGVMVWERIRRDNEGLMGPLG